MKGAIQTLIVCGGVLLVMGLFVALITARQIGNILGKIREDERRAREEEENHDHDCGIESEL